MAARTMSFESDSTSERWHLGRKLALLILLVVAAALGLVILLRQKSDFPLLIFNLFADVSIGLIVGIATRIVLSQRHGLIRGLASAALSVIGLFVLGYFSNGQSGVVLPPVGFVKVDWLSQWRLPLELPLRIENSQVNWLALVDLVIAIDVSWIALRAWRRSTSNAVAPASVPSRRTRKPARSSRAAAVPHLSFPKIRIGNSGAKPKVQRKRTRRPVISKPTFSAAIQPARSKRWNPLHRKPQIQLAVHEEHRCPYCLEEVKRNDPRGVVECEVCHTLHHKDCWDITGACQVPHLNT